MRTETCLMSLLAALCMPIRAEACGGFFCSSAGPLWTPPIVQSGERVLFSVDGDRVTAVIELAYEGRRESLGDNADFAWVIPLPSVPDVHLGPEALFNVLDAATAPRLGLNSSSAAQCCTDRAMESESDRGGFLGSPIAWSDVTVLHSAQLGPYDMAVVASDSASSLAAWLSAHGFDQPPSAAGPLSHYINRGSVFLAVRLVPDADAGALRPLVLTYTSPDVACVPLILTAIATADSLPITVWMAGPARAVPLNYFHATLSDAMFPWECTTSTVAGACAGPLRQMLGQVAEAGAGHTFVTEFAARPEAGIPSQLRALFGRYPLDLSGGLVGFARTLRDLGVPLSTESLDVIAAAIPVADDAPPECRTGAGLLITHVSRCAGFVPQTFSFEAARPALDVLGFAEERRSLELFAGASWLTRLSTVMTADDMNRDPFFGFNPDLPEVSASRVVTTDVHCKTPKGPGTVDVQGADNTTRRVPAQLGSCGTFVFTGESGEPLDGPGFTLELTSTQGAPELVPLAGVLAADQRLELAVPGATYTVDEVPAGPSLPEPPTVAPADVSTTGCGASPSGVFTAAHGAFLAALVVWLGLPTRRRLVARRNPRRY